MWSLSSTRSVGQSGLHQVDNHSQSSPEQHHGPVPGPKISFRHLWKLLPHPDCESQHCYLMRIRLRSCRSPAAYPGQSFCTSLNRLFFNTKVSPQLSSPTCVRTEEYLSPETSGRATDSCRRSHAPPAGQAPARHPPCPPRHLSAASAPARSSCRVSAPAGGSPCPSVEAPSPHTCCDCWRQRQASSAWTWQPSSW